MTSSAKKTQQNAYTETCKITETKTTTTRHKRSGIMVDARVHYTILKQHTPPHRHQPGPEEPVRRRRHAAAQRRRVLSDTQQCADETPRPAPAGHQGDKNYRVSVPPNNMSDRRTTIGLDTALNAP